jgi:Kef-type K+ transport system membrane component KefB
MHSVLTNSGFNETAVILLSLCFILLSGFVLTRFTKLINLPNVTGFIIAGVILGPHVLHIIPRDVIKHMGFISDISLAFIAFGVGKFFKIKIFRSMGISVIIITLLESLFAGVLITLSLHFIFDLSWDFCLLLGAIATATAPASTMMTIRQYRAKGKFIATLLQIVAFDDVVCLFVYSVAAVYVNIGDQETVNILEIILPVIYNFGGLAIGFACGFLLSKLITPGRSKDNRLILTIMLILGITGCCSIINISPLLSCMVFSSVYVNLTRDKKLYKQLNQFTPPILSIFFIVSGMSLDITSFRGLGLIGACYFIIRIIGKYLGAYIGCAISKMDARTKNYLGLALIPQAGVAIGLAFLGQRMLPEKSGDMLLTIILSSSVLYELAGPVCAKIAIIKSGSVMAGKK